MVSGSSSDPCSENFAGPNAFSEIEAVNLANFIVSHRDTIKAYLTLHSYGKSILYPWGYTFEQRIPDAIDLRALGNEMASVVHADYFMNEKGYTLSPASGGSDDYSKSVGVKYVYHINLRPGSIALAEDNSTKEWHGFLLTPRCIKPSAEEIFPAFLVAANKVRNGPF
uniref:Peptidase M14 carboxypeptidase A domain-containing protein n=1 Tax=Panagrolaimus sp. JU765 TaxID=591449 RepID=A0AC34RJD9_9BILA